MKPKVKKPVAAKKVFHVLYVQDSSPFLKKFKSKRAADKFIKEFQANPDYTSDDGYWIDLCFEGVVHYQDHYFGEVTS